MESITRFFMIAASLIITAGLVFIAFRMADIGSETANHVMQEFADMGNEIKDSEILQYDGVEVAGSDVANFLKKQFSQNIDSVGFVVKVVSDKGTKVYSEYEDVREIYNFSHTSYIEPMAVFRGTVYKNENGVITEVCFEKK